ncbi:MAG TPA: VIT1/CCC1 transporter family protein [Rhabdochlamydiaceae bacterium]|nr:VIT1/CCC1 transporter family protein [Rhabdochlamydiaceae bacterium]
MSHFSPPDHFGGKTVVEHLKEARTRGALAAAEIHGTEMPGHLSAASDAAKDSAFSLLILWVIVYSLLPLPQMFLTLLLFSCGWVIWKTGRSSLLSWARMERMHRLIEEERWEIEHNRGQERDELTEMYRAKGLDGKLLEEVIDVLMADDNRLLKVMLEEELGLTLEAYEHPLKQAFGAFWGSLSCAGVMLFAFWAHPLYGLPIAAVLVISSSSIIAAKLERNRALNAVIWNFAIAALTSGTVYFLMGVLQTSYIIKGSSIFGIILADF